MAELQKCGFFSERQLCAAVVAPVAEVADYCSLTVTLFCWPYGDMKVWRCKVILKSFAQSLTKSKCNAVVILAKT